MRSAPSNVSSLEIELRARMQAEEDPLALLGLLVEQALATVGARRGFAVLQENGTIVTAAAMVSRRGGIEPGEIERAAAIWGEALRSMRPSRAEVADDGPLPGWDELAREPRSVLCVPFEAREDLRGAIYVERPSREGPFDDGAERLLELRAEQAALTLVLARRAAGLRASLGELERRVAGEGTAPAADRRLPVRSLEDLERDAILQALAAAGNDKRAAARMLGISRAKVYQRLKQWADAAR